MKRIMILSDLSGPSENAAQFALQMFGAPKADAPEFVILHAYQYMRPAPPYGGLATADESKLMQEARERFSGQVRSLKKKFPGQSIREVWKQGNLIPVVQDFLASETVDEIVVGAEERTGVERWLLGSNARQLAKEIDRTLLVVPAGAAYRKPEKIVFATDFRNLEDLSILNPLRDMMATFDAQLMMLHIYREKKTSSGERTQMSRMLNDYFRSDNYSHYFLEHDDPAEGIEQFMKGYNADMLALVASDRTFFENLFHKSVTKKMLLHSEVPFFILNTKYMEKEDQVSFKSKMKDQITKWKGELDEVRVQAKLGKMELKDEIEKRRKMAEEKLEKAKEKLGDVEEVTEDKWDHFKKEMGEAVDHVKKAFSGK